LSKAVDAGGKELPPLSAQAVVQQEGATWHLELTTEMDGRRGTRRLEADSCEGLARAATLVLALTLGEGLARRQQAEVEEQEARALPAPEVSPALEPAPVPTQEPEAFRVLLWAAAVLGSDPLGAFGPAAALGVALQPNLLQIGLRLEGTLPRSTQFAGSGGDVHGFSLTADLQACLAPQLSSIQLAACANAGVTAWSVSGDGTARDSRVLIPLYSLGPSIGARWLVSDNAFLSLGLVSRFFLLRPDLVVEGLPQRRPIETASVSAELGGGVRW